MRGPIFFPGVVPRRRLAVSPLPGVMFHSDRCLLSMLLLLLLLLLVCCSGFLCRQEGQRYVLASSRNPNE